MQVFLLALCLLLAILCCSSETSSSVKNSSYKFASIKHSNTPPSQPRFIKFSDDFYTKASNKREVSETKIIWNFTPDLTACPTCIAVPDEVQQACILTSKLLSVLLDISITVNVDLHWFPISSCSSGGCILGVGGSTFTQRCQKEFMAANPSIFTCQTWFPAPLSVNLINKTNNPDDNEAHIVAKFNSAVNFWSFSLNGTSYPDKADFISVIMHELVHGLGFISSTTADSYDVSSDCSTNNCTYVYDLFIQDSNSIKLTDVIGKSQYKSFVTSNDLFFVSPTAKKLGASQSQSKIKLSADSTFVQGTSISHFDEATFPRTTANSMMTPVISNGEVIHHPGAYALAVLGDLGWNLRDCRKYTTCSDCMLYDCNWCLDPNGNQGNGVCGDKYLTPFTSFSQCKIGNVWLNASQECQNCGDSIQQIGEQCDNGPSNNDTTPNACRTTCKIPVCGDDITDTGYGEQCDLGKLNSNITKDGCRLNCKIFFCGDAVQDSNEQCDNGTLKNSNTIPNACRTTCKLPTCGDSVIDTNYHEQCDNGSKNSNTTANSCRLTCTNPICGDGILDNLFNEQCDSGRSNANSPNTCRPTCILPVCGDKIIDDSLGEQCDDGNKNSNNVSNACRSNCKNPVCGDGIVDSKFGEQCDNGTMFNSNSVPNACRLNCTLPKYGDGVKDNLYGEECDDGNFIAGDGCDAGKCENGTILDQCLCGNNVVDSVTASGIPEQCDSGNNNSDSVPNACRLNCQNHKCGDQVVDSDEQCDLGRFNNDSAPDMCRTTCVNASCGDSVVDSGEKCDNGPGNSDDIPDACRTNCVVAYCGDGVIDSGEECDKGITNSNGTICSAVCTFVPPPDSSSSSLLLPLSWITWLVV